jgi:hypothetical protein
MHMPKKDVREQHTLIQTLLSMTPTIVKLFAPPQSNILLSSAGKALFFVNTPNREARM